MNTHLWGQGEAPQCGDHRREPPTPTPAHPRRLCRSRPSGAPGLCHLSVLGWFVHNSGLIKTPNISVQPHPLSFFSYIYLKGNRGRAPLTPHCSSRPAAAGCGVGGGEGLCKSPGSPCPPQRHRGHLHTWRPCASDLGPQGPHGTAPGVWAGNAGLRRCCCCNSEPRIRRWCQDRKSGSLPSVTDSNPVQGGLSPDAH